MFQIAYYIMSKGLYNLFMTELECAIACQKGDKDQFGPLYDSYSEKIYNYIYYRTHHAQTAQDITSDVFFKALSKINTFDPDKGNFGAWLYRIARNTLTDYYRTRKPEANIDDVWDIASDDDVERDTDVAMQLNRVKKYLDKLPKDKRDIIIMRLWDDMSYQDIANIVGKSEEACKMTFSRAIRQLRESVIIIALFIFTLLY